MNIIFRPLTWALVLALVIGITSGAEFVCTQIKLMPQQVLSQQEYLNSLVIEPVQSEKTGLWASMEKTNFAFDMPKSIWNRSAQFVSPLGEINFEEDCRQAPPKAEQEKPYPCNPQG